MTTHRKPTTETLAERLAFNDPDRQTETHDRICLWLDEWLRLPESAKKLDRSEWNPTWVDKQIAAAITCRDERVARLRDEIQLRPGEPDNEYSRRRIGIAQMSRETWLRWAPSQPEPRPVAEIGDITWELAIGNDRWVSGFIDIAAVMTSASSLKLHAVGHGSHFACEPPEWEVSYRDIALNFEVKSTIPSLGEVIRQVRYYQSKLPGRYFIVSPDTRHQETIVSQGIGFIEYPTGLVWQ